MIPHDTLHAMAYANQSTRVYMFQRFKRRYPNLFVHAIFETRSADSSRDYYVPPSIADRCIVIEKVKWNREGCAKVACFPYKNHEDPCVFRDEEGEGISGADRMRWLRVDNFGYTLACQPACRRGMALDTRYRGDDCFVSNAAKKLYAMNPERYNGRVAKGVRLTLDPETERLEVNALYCEAYGTNFDPETKECFIRTGQMIAEIFIGSSVFRRKLIAKNYLPKPEPPPAPSDLEKTGTTDDFERAWDIGEEPPDPTLSTAEEGDESTHVLLEETDLGEHDSKVALEKLASQLAIELGVDIGINVSLSQLKNYLIRKISKPVVSRALVDPAVKYAVLNGSLKSAAVSTRLTQTYASGVTQAGLKSSFALATAAVSIYSLVSLLIDVFDPHEYGKMLEKEKLDEINDVLDWLYFKTDPSSGKSIRFTPEDAMEILATPTDVEVEIRYYKKRFDEYKETLYGYPRKEINDPSIKWFKTTSFATSDNALPASSTRKQKTTTWPLWGIAFVTTGFTTIKYGFKYVDVLALFLCLLFFVWTRSFQ